MLIVTFSGIDGCGKSTQVELTTQYLADHGLRVRRVAALRWSAAGIQALIRDRWKARRRLRAAAAPTEAKACVAAATRQVPPPIRTYAQGRSFDQDRRSWAVRLRRAFVYPIDCLLLVACVWRFRLAGYDAVVFDRYTFDKMVGLPDPNCRLSRLLRRIAPQPACSFLIDTPPEVARARRPEHTDDYHSCKSADYRALAALDLGLTAVPSGSIDEVHDRVCQNLARHLPPTVRGALRPTVS